MNFDKSLVAGFIKKGLLAGLGFVLFVAVYIVSQIFEPGPLKEEKLFFVPPATLPDEIGQNAVADGVIGSSLIFNIAVRTSGFGRKIRAGEYEVPTHTSLYDFLKILTTAAPYRRYFLVKEGATSFEVRQNLISNVYLVGEIPQIPEGSVLPDTYDYLRGESAAALVRRMQAAMTRAVDEAVSGANTHNLTRNEIVVLASIVEKETGITSERPIVAAVFLNRLGKKMRLQADSTVIYGRQEGRPFGRAIFQSDLDHKNPYNTYRINGLPPGPIANPGIDSIKAVVSPANVPYLYFVADGTGGHVFAETLKEHNQNVARWRAIKNARDPQ